MDQLSVDNRVYPFEHCFLLPGLANVFFTIYRDFVMLTISSEEECRELMPQSPDLSIIADMRIGLSGLN
jgi:hypothetical protein